MKIAISACLLGDNVRYDGTNKKNNKLIKLLKKHEIIKICPEVLSGLSIPRKVIEIRNNKAINTDNINLTEQLNKACIKCLETIKDCDFVILKSKSPTCGYGKIYDGTFTNTLIEGNGMFTKLCLQNNIKILTESDIKEIEETIEGAKQ